jgi:hypothetical protein
MRRPQRLARWGTNLVDKLLSTQCMRAILEGPCTGIAIFFVLIVLILASPLHAQSIAAAEAGKFHTGTGDGIPQFKGISCAAPPW